MKKIIKSSLYIALVLILSQACKKSEINGDAKTLIQGSYITLDSVLTQNLDFSQSTATVGIKVDEYGDPVASVDVFVAKGDQTDSSQWVKIKTYPFTKGMTMTVSTAELATALAPDTITPGNIYYLQNVVRTKDGRAFSVVNTPSTYNSFPAYKMALTWKATAVCAFVQAAAVGTYAVTYDNDWQDYSVGDHVAVAAGTADNQLSLVIYPSTGAGGNHQVPVVLNIDKATGEVSVAETFTGYYGASTTMKLLKGTNVGYVFSCTGVITLSLNWVYGGAEYDALKFALKKLP